MSGRDPETKVTVTEHQAIADGVVGVALRRPDGGPLPAWEPGAHIDLVLGDGLVRQYSLCGDPADTATWRLAVLREPQGRGGSAYVHDRLTTGTTLLARGPRNRFPLVESSRYLFIAGGIGITPIRPMVAAAEAAGADWRLVYGGRRRSSMAFLGELAGFARDTRGGRVEIRSEDETGPLPLDDLLGEPQPGTLVYCCGPAGLLEAVEARCAAWPEGTLHLERFAPGRAGDTGNGSAGMGADEETISVRLARSERDLVVPPGTSILRAAEDAGVLVLSSCREGTCGTCETTVLDGVPDHRDSILTGAERDSCEFMMICVSRARSRHLVLDL